MSTLINGQNYFNPRSLYKMVETLNDGEAIGIYIDCIGHTRTAHETERYVEALREEFGDRLVIDTKSHWYTLYKLKGADSK